MNDKGDNRLRVLFVCARNKWRSPTAERHYRNDARFDVRSAGLSDRAPRTLSMRDLDWAEVVCVMEPEHKKRIVQEFGREFSKGQIRILDIPDEYRFMDPELIELIEVAVERELGEFFE